MGFTTGEPWLPLAKEHAGLTVEDQEGDLYSTLSFARQMIAFKKDSRAMRLGGIQFLAEHEHVLGFVRRDGRDAVACLFNFSDSPQVLVDRLFAGAEILPLGSGFAEMRGASVGLSPHAAIFLTLAN